jgi:hypothetical protein
MPILPFFPSLPQSFLPTQNSGEPTNITLSDGSTLTNSVIYRAEPDCVYIYNGVDYEKYSYQELTPDLRDKYYRYDPTEVASWKAERNKEALRSYNLAHAANFSLHVIQTFENGVLGVKGDLNNRTMNLVFIKGVIGIEENRDIVVWSYKDGEFTYSDVNGMKHVVPQLSALKEAVAF